MKLKTTSTTTHEGKRLFARLAITVSIAFSTVFADAEQGVSDDVEVADQRPQEKTEVSTKESESTKETRLPPDLLQRVTVHRKEYLRNEHTIVAFEVEKHVLLNSEGEEKWTREGKSFLLTSPGGVRVTINPSTGKIGRVVAAIPFYIDVIRAVDEHEPTQVWFAVPQDDVYEKLELWQNGDVELAVGDRYEVEKRLMTETAQTLLETFSARESE